MQVQKTVTVTTGLRMRERFLQCSMETARWPNPREPESRSSVGSDSPANDSVANVSRVAPVALESGLMSGWNRA